MAFNEINIYNSPNFTPESQVRAVFGMPRSIDYITIHHWGDPGLGPTFEGVVNWLCNPRSLVSAQDVITGTGRRVAVIVDYMNASWHAGTAAGNATSIGFECDPRARDEDYEVVAEDVAATWTYYGRIIPLRPHKSWIATACPGSYDLARIHNMALAIYNGEGLPKVATREEVYAAYLEILEREGTELEVQTHINTGMTIGSIRSIMIESPERKRLEARKEAEYAKNEWVTNLKPYTPGDTEYNTSVKLAVLPADGILRYNLETGGVYNNERIPRGTIIDIVAKTKVKGVDYLISRYSKKAGMPSGLVISDLGVPAEPPENEKPLWLKNLQDIADKPMWTRSETPVLKLEDGTVTEMYPINKRVLITHATQIVGKDLLVLEGGTHAIETLYLNDHEIRDPYDDLEKRVSRLEKIIKQIQDYFASLGK